MILQDFKSPYFANAERSGVAHRIGDVIHTGNLHWIFVCPVTYVIGAREIISQVFA